MGRNEYIEKNMEEGSKVKEAFKVPYGERGPIPQGYGIRTGLSDLLKPLNSEYGVTAKEDSIPTYIVMVTGIVLLFLFYTLLLLINNQSVLLPPEDEFDEYVANFLPYFFFGCMEPLLLYKLARLHQDCNFNAALNFIMFY